MRGVLLRSWDSWNTFRRSQRMAEKCRNAVHNYPNNVLNRGVRTTGVVMHPRLLHRPIDGLSGARGCDVATGWIFMAIREPVARGRPRTGAQCAPARWDR